MKKELVKPIGGICLAACLWTVMFSPVTAPHLNFWVAMTCSAVMLTVFSRFVCRDIFKSLRFGWSDILLGVFTAALLWGIFWVGDKLSSLMFDFARGQVDTIYGMKEGENPYLLTALMLFVIGPAEELFWRGYVQRTLSGLLSPNKGFIVTTIVYALVHVASLNFMLVMAAFVAGAIWGIGYRFFPDRLGALVISHALWDCAVFIWFPI
ncbi:MAG: lysostaphin resistance A-like protein [Candidatus Cryptobacteroides sp.]